MLRRVFRNALLGAVRHSGLSLATILVITLAFGATSAFALFAFGSEKIIDYYESRALVTAFFKDDATEEQILALRDELLERPGVIEVVYTSKDEAFALYSEQFKDRPELLESIPTNILPASLDVRTESLDILPQIAEFFQGNELVEEVTFYQDVVERFKNLVNVARISLLGLTGVFSLISIVVVLITIGLIIHSMEKEIEIMALMGDSADNIPGVPGIGEKTAVELIKQFGSLDKLLENVDTIKQERLRENLKQYSKQAVLSRELAILDREAPIDFSLDKLRLGEPNSEKLFNLFQELEFRSLLKEVASTETIKTKAEII